tara:strand:+ start:547 stop:993 length:447 start_codon:yes stop_codon:yes gene_type:complete
MSDNEKNYKISEVENRVINLTLYELLFIDDAITLMIDSRDLEHMFPLKPQIRLSLVAVPIDLIDKIGNGILEHMRMNKPASQSIPIKISEMELYMLREISLAKAEYFGKQVGISLKRKVYSALFTQKNKQHDFLEQLLKDIDLGEKND